MSRFCTQLCGVHTDIFSEPGTSTEAETLTTDAQDTTETEQEEVKRLIAEQFEEQRRFMAEQFREQERFISEQFEKYFD